MQVSLVLIVCLFIIAQVSSSISLSSDKWVPDKWRTKDDADFQMQGKNVDAIVATDEKMIDDIYKFEEKLKRTYFHVKPLDQKQLRVWDQYLDWQVAQGDHQRTVVLFERCLIPCALYEQYWAKYARYLERAHKEGREMTGSGVNGGVGVSDGDIGKARNAFGTGLGTVDQLREARCTRTLRGGRETVRG